MDYNLGVVLLHSDKLKSTPISLVALSSIAIKLRPEYPQPNSRTESLTRPLVCLDIARRES